MNREKILQAADYIEKVNGIFDMEVWCEEDAECGTAACIAGWVCIMEGVSSNDEGFTYYPEEAQKILGLDRERGEALFAPDGDSDEFEVEHPWSPYCATKEQGARVLRLLAETGEVRWKEVMNDDWRTTQAHRAP